MRDKVLTVQRVLLGNAKRQPFLRLRRAAVVSQAGVRAKQQRKRYLEEKSAAMTVQRVGRGYLGRQKAKRVALERAAEIRRRKEAEAARCVDDDPH